MVQPSSILRGYNIISVPTGLDWELVTFLLSVYYVSGTGMTPPFTDEDTEVLRA